MIDHVSAYETRVECHERRGEHGSVFGGTHEGRRLALALEVDAMKCRPGTTVLEPSRWIGKPRSSKASGKSTQLV
jgi:hypothetical protein